ncbi:MAG: dienelactone hydrolase family protein [Colwellia sp.]|nr:dienelactone hydrolase family protein [Colwellia sp.]
MNKLSILIVLLSILFLSPTLAKKLTNDLPSIYYVSIPVQTEDAQWQLSGQYRLPKNQSNLPVPAVLILHSTSGVDSTGSFYAKALNKMGIATLEVDLWGARGMQGGSEDRPALPQETLPDTFAALQYLATRDEIDQNRIGVIGFSWGGVLSMLTATEHYMAMTGNEYRFAGHVAHYPVCWVYNLLPGFDFENLTGAPVMIQTGELDDYDLVDTCELMVNQIPEVDQQFVKINSYKNAYHAWDRLEPEWVVEDPFSHLGQGGEVTLSPNRAIARKSKRKVVAFFNKLFF